MTTFDQPAIEFPSAPTEGGTRAVVEAVANDVDAHEDWLRFASVCRFEAAYEGVVDPAGVRAHLIDVDGALIISPRRLSAFYNRATGKNGFLDFSHWGVNTDTKGRNAGRPARIYKLRVTA